MKRLKSNIFYLNLNNKSINLIIGIKLMMRAIKIGLRDNISDFFPKLITTITNNKCVRVDSYSFCAVTWLKFFYTLRN